MSPFCGTSQLGRTWRTRQDRSPAGSAAERGRPGARLRSEAGSSVCKFIPLESVKRRHVLSFASACGAGPHSSTPARREDGRREHAGRRARRPSACPSARLPIRTTDTPIGRRAARPEIHPRPLFRSHKGKSPRCACPRHRECTSPPIRRDE
jgi:hypothetical protein